MMVVVVVAVVGVGGVGGIDDDGGGSGDAQCLG